MACIVPQRYHDLLAESVWEDGHMKHKITFPFDLFQYNVLAYSLKYVA